MSSTAATAQPAAKPYSPGLEGVVAGETQLSFVNSELKSLMYRGYDIRDLSENATFEEVAYLMLYGKLPNTTEYKTFCDALVAERTLPAPVIEALKTFPNTIHPMDALRTGTALLAMYDDEVPNNSHDANVRKAIRLTAKLPLLAAYSHRLSQGQPIVEPDNSLSHGANFLYMLLGEKPNPETAKLFDTTLIAYVDHGFNASTFAARVTTSTLSDLHSGIVSAIGTLKGPLHGGANEEAMKLLMEIPNPEAAEAFILDALATKKKIMGFGHRAYKNGDPRAVLLNEKAKDLCERTGQMRWFNTAKIVQDVMLREKNIHPNVDFPTAYIYYVMGLPIPIYTPMFAIARIAGWSAHVIEQLDHNKLIRPSVLYTGPQHVAYVPMVQR
ncbi:MAG: citrate/2-methylcitrate synthase [Vampirovibrionales bacterium]|nr:citrate/2-methylcitrate synthase [Vampirovibrionales bacterium]